MVQSPSWEANRFAASQELLAFHGTRSFITALTSVRLLSVSWASPIQSIYPYPTCWRSVLILSTHLRLCLPSGLLTSGFPTLYTPLPSPIRATCPAHLLKLFISALNSSQVCPLLCYTICPSLQLSALARDKNLIENTFSTFLPILAGGERVNFQIQACLILGMTLISETCLPGEMSLTGIGKWNPYSDGLKAFKYTYLRTQPLYLHQN